MDFKLRTKGLMVIIIGGVCNKRMLNHEGDVVVDAYIDIASAIMLIPASIVGIP